MAHSKQLAAEIAATLARGTPHPEATQADWKRYIADIKKRFHAAHSAQERDLLQEEYKTAQIAMRSAAQGAAKKPTFLTGTNLFALKEMVLEHGGPEFPSRVAAVHAPHLKRCVDAGLIEVEGSRARLTSAGREMIADELVKEIAQEERWVPRENTFVPSAEKRAELLAKDVREHDAKLRRLEQTLAKLA